MFLPRFAGIAALLTLYVTIGAAGQTGPSSGLPDSVEEERCETCHGFEGMKTFRDGREIPLHVDFGSYLMSAHADVACLECHVGIDQNKTPHADPIPAATCDQCHRGAVFAFGRGLHARETTCTACHRPIHSLQENSSEARCTSCHKGASGTLDASVHSSDEHPFTCTSCHIAHLPEAHQSANCLVCHEAGSHTNLPPGFADVDIPGIDAPGPHSQDPGCAACHTGHSVQPALNPLSTIHRDSVVATCGSCHRGAVRGFSSSTHGMSLEAGNPRVPTCISCHDEHHHEPPDGASRAFRQNQRAAACQDCHIRDSEVTSRMRLGASFASDYERSIHGRERASGNSDAPTCVSCHGAHRILGADHPDSRMHPDNQPARCGRCHEGIDSLYSASIHGTAVAYGFDEAPVCTTCHGDHLILGIDDPNSPVFAERVSREVCGPCHSSITLSDKFDIPVDRLETFSESFHGRAAKLGSDEVANCVSCHGVHDILPDENPASRIHPANLVETCGTCHPGANLGFVAGSVHVVRSREGSRLLYWISTIYLLFISVVIGSMVLHNGLDWVRKILNRIGLHRDTEQGIAGGVDHQKRRSDRKLVLRMTRGERVQHVLLMVSFSVLVFTGFMLAYPDAFWVQGLVAVFGSAAGALRGPVHRVAAVLLIGVSIYHIGYRLFTERGRSFSRDIRMRMTDVRDMFTVLRRNLGQQVTKPTFGQFSYVEKVEYWSVVWGTAIMAVTGIAMWFETRFMGWFSKLFVDACDTIHYMEAWLALLAILVWHFYAVMFDPDVSPMNVTWITGMREEEEDV